MNPFRWYRLQNGDDVSKYRETINGFPCRLILINDGSTPLNEGQNEPTPGNTKDMGIFNFNNDKDNVTTLGFNSDIFPNCASYEVTANSDTSAGAFMSYGRINGQWMENLFVTGARIAYNINYSGLTTVKVNPGEKYRIVRTGGTLLRVAIFNELPYDGLVGSGRLSSNDTEYTITIPDGYSYMAIYAGPEGKPEDIKIYNVTSYNEADELAYLKESFELRHPDADDVAEDWGYMGVDEESVINYWITYNEYYTVKIPIESLGTNTLTISNTGDRIARCHQYGFNGSWIGSIEFNQNVPFTISDSIHYIALQTTINNISNDESITINGELYKYGQLVEEANNIQTPIKPEPTGLKALIDWVDNCTDEEFVNDFEEHFHKDYTLRYFCLVTLIGAVDNLGGQYSCRV
jgi:hypothetical protein